MIGLAALVPDDVEIEDGDTDFGVFRPPPPLFVDVLESGDLR